MEKTQIPGKTEIKKRRWQQRMICLAGIIDSMNLSWSKLRETVKYRDAGVLRFMELQSQTQFSD